MNIVVVVDDVAVKVYKKWSDVKKNHGDLRKEDFVKVGEDYLLVMDKESYRISRDITLLESVASERVFGKKSIDWATAFVTSIMVVVSVMLFG